MKPRLETLHATGAALRHAQIFALVPILTLRGREPLAFNREQWIEIVMPPTFDPNDFARRCRNEIDPTRQLRFIRLLNAELEHVPARGFPGHAIQVGTEL
ncbi:hypothetical protein [Ancylobacter lacus]|uniref:hypothetical protein n=1 Tax=Ancylobacter lacus TaxID=2579970 RepID=UPI001FE4AD6D|nr:hypothetical protein [Ancylobacter lacus]